MDLAGFCKSATNEDTYERSVISKRGGLSRPTHPPIVRTVSVELFGGIELLEELFKRAGRPERTEIQGLDRVGFIRRVDVPDVLGVRAPAESQVDAVNLHPRAVGVRPRHDLPENLRSRPLSVLVRIDDHVSVFIPAAHVRHLTRPYWPALRVLLQLSLVVVLSYSIRSEREPVASSPRAVVVCIGLPSREDRSGCLHHPGVSIPCTPRGTALLCVFLPRRR